MPTPAIDDLSWLNDAVLGGHLPPAAQTALQRAGQAWHDDVEAEHWLDLATACAPEHPAVFIARYRFYFYKHRLSEALNVAERSLMHTAQRLGIATDWRMANSADVMAALAPADHYEPLPRFYLFTLKAQAYLMLRLGRFEEARAMLDWLARLDPKDKMGGRLLGVVLARFEEGDDDE